MTKYYETLKYQFSPEAIRDAVVIAKKYAEIYQEPYFTDSSTFEPHLWVVAAIADALTNEQNYEFKVSW